MPVQFDDSRWPLIDVQFVGEFGVEDMKENHRRTFEVIDARREPFVVVINALRTEAKLDAAFRKTAAELYARMRPMMKEYCRGQAMILSSAIQRGLFTAITWVAPTPNPVKVFATQFEGETWLQKQLPFPGQPRAQKNLA